jgi:hypothetical protein
VETVEFKQKTWKDHERYGKIMTGWWCKPTIEIVDLPIKK